ncbi:hypothetical protein Glo7428_3644 [Gloeocapsa sp. PCC 7428]|uniref:hypothetical protein n=1 Tax=Gloeocapsa sp. PCC 7428 TaxID=1173026 RepID=UPI0002A5C193|nr:hypothetical protein [Gloeocapsa sp. PCC 7428]AFZ32110.1 hypothetical protein Glo7428_3644 [Gloeocapsa sp. PCC 7428]
MSKFWQPKRVLACTLIALTSGIVSAYIGSQISLKVQSQKCQNQPWGLETACQAWVAPGAVWQGGTTGLYLGTLLGGIVSILGTIKGFTTKEADSQEKIADNLALFADELELTPTQRVVLQRFLILVTLKLAASSQTTSQEDTTLSVEELQQLLAIAKHKQLLERSLTSEQIAQLLKEIGICSDTRRESPFRIATHIPGQTQDN